MPSPTLFPHEEEPLVPAPDREEPVVWLRRLVVLSELGSTEPIRDITFRRGLNIVQTRQRPAGEAHVVGHSVGKTLLMRLIRYTLGEQHFTVADVRPRIANLFTKAHVVAIWRVSGREWTVVRPLREGRVTNSFAVESGNWQTAIGDDQARRTLAEFVSAVSDAVLADLPEVTLPKARRPPRWLDVLGWLARDHECGYRPVNEWRHDDANSGPSLDRDDNSIILQWMLGLLGEEEAALKNEHQRLLDERNRKRASRDSAQRTIDATGPSLSSKLELEPQEPLGGDDREELFSARVVAVANDKVKSLERLRGERLAESSLGSLEETKEAARTNLVDAEADLRFVEKQIEKVKAGIKQLSESDAKSPYALASPYEDCSYSECPLRLANRPTPDADPAKDHHLAVLREELVEHRSALPGKEAVRDERKSEYTAATEKGECEQERLSAELSGIDQDIGRWQGYLEDAKRYREATRLVSRSVTSIETLDRRIDDSSTAQEAARQDLREGLRRLTTCYARTLRDLLGETADGEIVVDGRGLHPRPDNRLAPNGAALTVMTSVLAFDIASMAASAYGIGRHPRLLLHDSPREGDMEEPLFHALFRAIRRLESEASGREPPFQYIATTTTPPPPELADEEGPFVRETLDARTPDGHLLRASF